MQEQNLPKGILEKLQKLIRLQEKAGTQEEAANAASKIREMLLKYNLEMSQVEAHGASKAAENIERDVFDPMNLTKKSEGGWVSALTSVIAKHNMCSIVGLSRSSTQIYIIGTKTNVQITWFLVEQLVNRLRPMSREYFAKYEGREKRNTFFRGFYMGAVKGINEKLNEDAAREVYHAKEAMSSYTNQRKLDETQTQALALTTMLSKERKRVEEYIGREFGELESKKIRTTRSIGGREAGYNAGKNMSINQGLE